LTQPSGDLEKETERQKGAGVKDKTGEGAQEEKGGGSHRKRDHKVPA
jgi:hypothetical protein